MLRHYGDRIGAKHMAVYPGEITDQELCTYALSREVSPAFYGLITKRAGTR